MTKEAKLQWRIKQAVLRKLDATHERVKWAHFFTPYTKVNSNWVKILNVEKQYTVQLLEINIGETFCDINHSDIFLDQSPKAKEISIKAKVNKWDLIKLKSLLCTAKETINKTKRKPTEQEKVFSKDAADTGLLSKI